MKRFLSFFITMVLLLTSIPSPLQADTLGLDAIFNNKVVYVNSYYSGTGDHTNAIISAMDVLSKAGGGTLVFPKGDYKVVPDKIYMKSNIKWLGESGARIYSAATTGYSALVRAHVGAKNLVFENLIFDQMGDVSQVPDPKNYKSCLPIHLMDADNIEINSCTFYFYSLSAVLTQSSYATPLNTIKVINNKAYFKRKVNTFYDVSCFNIDGRTVIVTGNTVEGIYQAGYNYWKPRSGFEIHSPNCTIDNNKATNVELGILHVNWPMLWNTYEPNYVGNISIQNNTIEKAIIGVDVFSANTLAGTVTRNMKIENNTINLHLDSLYFPARGIALGDGDVSGSSFEDISIKNNTITVTKDPSIASIKSRMYLLISGDMVGAIYMNVKSSIKRVEVANNKVYNFPYCFLNLYRRNDAGSYNVHSDVNIHDNYIEDVAYTSSYGQKYDAIFNIGNVSNIQIKNNQIVEKNEKSIEVLRQLGNVSGLTYSVYAPPAPPTPTPTDPTRVYDYVIGTWANEKQIYVYNIAQCLAGDTIITPNNQEAVISRVSGNYIYLETGVTSWSGGKALQLKVIVPVEPEEPETPVDRVYDYVIGTWANSTLIYVYNISQCLVNDVVLFPNNQTATITKVNGNYITVNTALTSWSGGKALTLQSAQAPVVDTKVYNNVIGTWAYARQIYVYNIDQCAVGDEFLSPNNEKTQIVSISGNYVYTSSDLTSWYGGKALTYVKKE